MAAVVQCYMYHWLSGEHTQEAPSVYYTCDYEHVFSHLILIYYFQEHYCPCIASSTCIYIYLPSIDVKTLKAGLGQTVG